MQELYVAMDIETTGLDLREHVICQFGATLFTSQSIHKTFTWDVHVDEEHIETASVEALSLNGFTPERMRAGISFEAVIKDFESKCLAWSSSFQEKGVIWCPCFHNAPFDVAFLKLAGAETYSWKMKHFLRRVLDTVTMGWMLGEEKLSLRNLAESLLLPSDIHGWDHHDAGSDSLITARIVQESLMAGVME